MADADEFQNVLWHVAQILQPILLSRIQITFIVMYVRPNPSKKCGICTLFYVQFITRTKILLRFWVWLTYGRFSALCILLVPGNEVLLVTPRCENRHVSRNRFLVQKYTAMGMMGHIKFIIQATQVRDDIMWHVQEFLVFAVFWCYCNYWFA